MIALLAAVPSTAFSAQKFKAKYEDFVGTWVGTWSDHGGYSKLTVWSVRPDGSTKTLYAWKGGSSYKDAKVEGNSLTHERWGDGSIMVYTMTDPNTLRFRVDRKGKIFTGVLRKQ